MNKYLVIILPVAAILFFSCSSSQYKNVDALLPDLTQKADGSYPGEANFKGVPTSVSLETVIRNHKIISINIINHSASPIGRKAEKITETIIEKQSLDVDVVSGATLSSNAIRKAVENSLQ